MGERKLSSLGVCLICTLALAAETPPDSEIEALRAKANAALAANKNAEALPLAEELLALKKRKLGEQNPDVARSLNALGVIHEKLGHAAEAEKFLREGLEMRRKLLGSNDPLTAESALNLGQFLVRAKRYDEAEQYLKEATRIRQRKFGNSAETSAALQAEAELYLAWAKFDKGQAAAQVAAQMRLAVLPWPDSRTATSFDYLAAMEWHLKHFKEAVSAREQSFWSFEALYGLANPQTLQCGRLLAENLISAGEFERARAIYQRIDKEWDSQRHDPVDRARMLATQAALLKKMADLEGAIAIFHRIVALADKIPEGQDSDLIINANFELANCLFTLRRYKEAEPLFLERIERLEKKHRSEEVRSMHEWMGKFYSAAGEREKANEYFTRLIQRTADLPNQPRIELASACTEFGKWLNSIGDLQGAAAQLERSVTVHRQLDGSEHENTLKSEDEWADILEALRSRKALELRRHSLTARERLFGPKSDQVAEALRRLGWTCKQFGQYAEAEEAWQRLLVLRQEQTGPESELTCYVLRLLAILYAEEQLFDKSHPLFEKIAEIFDRKLGPTQAQTLQAWRDVADSFDDRGEFEKAEALYRRELAKVEKAFGQDHYEVSVISLELGKFLSRRESFDKAEPLLRRALAIRQKVRGPDNDETLDCLRALSEMSRKKKDPQTAITWSSQLLERVRRKNGNEHPSTLRALADLAADYTNSQDFPRAIALRKEELQLAKKIFGPESSEAVTHTINLAATYGEARQFEKAEPLYREALAMREKLDGPDANSTASACVNLAWCYKEMKRFNDAQPLYERALRIREKLFGTDADSTIDSLSSLSTLFEKMGAFTRAAECRREIVARRERVSGKDHALTGTALQDLGMDQYFMGNYSAAIETLLRAVQILEHAYGRESIVTLRAYAALGVSYMSQGDFGQAQPILTANLDLVRKLFGDTNQYTAGSLSVLGILYYSIGDYSRAERILREALDVNLRTIGEKDNATISSMIGVALAAAQQGKSEAIAMAQHALALCEEVNGTNHLLVIAVLKPLALIHARFNRMSEAHQEILRCIKMGEAALDPKSGDMILTRLVGAYICLADGALDEAAAQAEMCLSAGNETLRIGSSTRYSAAKLVAKSRFLKGDREGALAANRTSEEAFEAFLVNLFSFTSEEQRLTAPLGGSFDLSGTLSDTTLLTQSVLRIKGVILDSLLEDRTVAAEANRQGQAQQLSELRDLKRQLFQFEVGGLQITDGSLPKPRPEQLQDRIARIEASMAQTLGRLGRARHALETKTEQIQAALSPGTVLVEFLRYDFILSATESETRYGAVVIPPTGKCAWIPLGKAATIENEIALYQKSVRGKTDETVLRKGLHTIHDYLWAPIEAALPSGTKTVILSPDGQLNFLSFAILLNSDDQFLAEKYSVRYVASGRDLLKKAAPAQSNKMLVFADPDFGNQRRPITASHSEAIVMRSLEMNDLENFSLTTLNGTADEAAALKKRAGNAAEVFLGSNATELELRKVNSPLILHLATHGFFLPEMDLGPQKSNPIAGIDVVPKARLVNPMHRSGLALAGAQTTLAAWRLGEGPPTDNDGIVTAEEVGELDLNGTWLVVLSACDTGLGEARAGEGVMGLRRGFVQAGAQNLLMTLWPIRDQTTVQIMLDFYEAAEKTHNAPQALAEVQRDWLMKLRKEKGLLEAVNLAGAFIMSSQGRN